MPSERTSMTRQAVHEVTVVPGDGIGPEIVLAARRVLDSASSHLAWHEVEAGEGAFRRHGAAVPQDVLDSVRRTRVALKGPTGTPTRGYPSPNAELRGKLGVWCGVRRAVSLPGCPSPFTGVDLTVIREMTEDLGRGAEQVVGPDAAISVKFTTREVARRIADFAYSYASAHGYRRVTIAHHATRLRATDGMFLAESLARAAGFPHLEVEDELLDSLAMHLAMDPARYGVILCSNFYGGLFSGLCAGVTGGVGLMAGASFGPDGVGLFEPAHGNAPKHAGQDRVNPIAMILSGALMLDHLGEEDAAARVRHAVARVVHEGEHVSYDLGGRAGTQEVADAVISALKAPAPPVAP
jgi:isocitrate dehydrogenase (NAD+)